MVDTHNLGEPRQENKKREQVGRIYQNSGLFNMYTNGASIPNIQALNVLNYVISK